MECPQCGSSLSGRKTLYRCESCGARYEVEFTCDVCGDVPELLEGCGSVSFYCSRCRAVKSRSSMNKNYKTLPSTSSE
jgi:hypothetical protein